LPTARFQWTNLPEPRLSQLAVALGLGSRYPERSLRLAYGARPTHVFAREAWPHLRAVWLADDDDLRVQIVEDLWQAGVGAGDFPQGREAETAFLSARNNTQRLREIVLAAFLQLGEHSAGKEHQNVQISKADQPEVTSLPIDGQESRTDGTAVASATATATALESSITSPGQPAPRKVLAKRSGTTLVELERRLWEAANALRGPVDPADFKTYVFPMVFWKWISDSWDYERSLAIAEYGKDVEPEVEADYHRFNLPSGSHWRDVTTKTDNVGSKIATALGRIEQANPDSLAGIFGDAAWGNKERLPESALVALIDTFNGLTLNPEQVDHDVLGQAYEYLLKNFADESGKKAGEFFTPRQVVRLIVRMLDPRPGESIYDPACGSGGMLVETINSVRAHDGDTRTLRLYGQEVNLTTAAIAKMNLFLHEIEDFKIVRGDTLRSPGLRRPDGTISQFDVVIANPPFSLSNWGADTWAADARSFCGVPPTKNGDFAWVQHMASSMTEDKGRVGVVMPHGVLFRGGVEARIRQCLIEQDRLEAVVSLPTNLFYSTSIPACVLIFRAGKPVERRNQVLFVDGSARFTKGRNQNQMSPADVDAIAAAYRTDGDPDGEDGVNVRLVPSDEIKTNAFDLNIGRYLRTAAVDTPDLATALANYKAARGQRIESEQTLFERLSAAAIADLADG
jgi:type I restriction enzyme M protein